MSGTVERFLEAHPFAAQVRYVTVRRHFRGGLAARCRAFWHYIVRRHPWEICGDCGRPVGLWWHAPDALWDHVNGSPYGVMCVRCFHDRAAASGTNLNWTATVTDSKERARR